MPKKRRLKPKRSRGPTTRKRSKRRAPARSVRRTKPTRSISRRLSPKAKGGTRTTGTRRRGPSIVRRLKDTERAIKTLGEKNVRRGSHVLGETRQLTPTKQGFKAVKGVIREVNKASRVGKRRTFTYDLEGSFRGADGKLHKFKRGQVGIPRLRDVKRKKGETQAAALSRVVEERIRRELMGILRDKLGGYVLAEKFKGRKISPKKAREQLERLKRTREVKFKVRFRREV